MPSAHLNLKEDEVVKLVLEFLHNRELHITQLSLEREAGVINGVFSDDMLFLRQLILDGQWDDVLEFIQPLESIEGFNTQPFHYIVYKHKYIELLCIKTEAGAIQATDVAVEEVVKCLNEIEKCAPSREEYSSLCLLLTLPRLSDHSEYKNWNPSSARVECFRSIYPLVEKYLPADRKIAPSSDKSKNGLLSTAKNDRLVQLVIKGLLYEYCVEYCQHKATSSSVDTREVQFGGLLDGTGFTDADLSLPSWLQSIPHDIFAFPFEQRTLNVDIERLEKPSLEASWTEHMLVTPFKPKTFPHSAMPSSRPRSAADIMSRSLNPHLDGLPFGLASQRHMMALSVGDLSAMSKSFASFHLTGKKSMNTSVDRLFEEADVFTSSSYGDIANMAVVSPEKPRNTQNKSPQRALSTSPPPMPPPRRPRSKSPEKKPRSDTVPMPTTLVITTPTVRGTPKKDGDEINTPIKNTDTEKIEKVSSAPKSVIPTSPELYKEFQRQKLKIQELINVQEKQAEELVKRRSDSSSVYYYKQPVADNRLKEAILDGGAKELNVQGGSLTIVGSSLQPQQTDLSNRASAGGIQGSSTPKSGMSPLIKGVITSPQISPVHMHRQDGQALANQNNYMMVASPCTNSEAARTLNPILKGSCPPQPNQPHATPPRVAGISSGLPTVTAGNYIRTSPYQFQKEDGFSSNHRSLIDTQMQSQVQQKAKHGVVTSQMKAQVSQAANGDSNSITGSNKPKFIPVTSLEDVQAIRAAEFHPNGKLYAIGSNSKTLRICTHPKMTDLREDHQVYQPTVLFKRTKHHKGSIYCLAWNATGELLATGSNDKTVKLMRFNSETCNIEGDDIELSMHDGTVRDMCFVEDLSNKASLLISGGAGDCKIYVTDCVTGTPFQALSGHSGHILSLYTWGGAMFVSGSQDRTIRFWDLRTRGCVNLIPSPPSGTGAVKGSAVAAVSVDPSGRMLVSGQEDATCMLYDIRGNRTIQVFKPHASDIRTIRFSPRAYYLLTGSYDNKVILTDLQGDLTLPLPSVVVAQHQDKVIQCRWHPTEFSFLSTSADKTATLWGLPAN